MLSSPVLLFLLALMDFGSSQVEVAPRGCGPGLQRPYTALCDLESIWGVVVEAVAGGGALAALLLAAVLLGRLRGVTETEKRSGLLLLLLLLAGIMGLFGLSFAYLVERVERVCIARRALWGVLFTLCFSCLLAQGWRLRRLARQARSPGGGALAGLTLGLTLVQGIINAEWLLLTVVRQGQPACDYLPLEFALACGYALALLLAALVASVTALFGGRVWRGGGAWLFAACLACLLLWATWLGLYLYGNKALGLSPAWDDAVLAVVLVAQGWLLLLLHAIPEAHACLRPQAQPSTPDYFNTSPPALRLQETSFDEDLPLPHRHYLENKAFSFDEHNAALKAGGYRNGNMSAWNSGPFRSNVYQPTEMAVLLNGGPGIHCSCPSMHHSQPGVPLGSVWRYCHSGANRSQPFPPATQSGSCGEGEAGDEIPSPRQEGGVHSRPWGQRANQPEVLFLDAKRKPMRYFVSGRE